MSKQRPENSQILIQASTLLSAASNLWCFLREPEIVEIDSMSGKDLDIWCPHASFSSVINAFLSHPDWSMIGGWKIDYAYGNNITVRLQHKSISNPHLEIFFGDLRWQNILYLSEDKISSKIKIHNDLPYISGSALLTILVTRVALRGKLSGERLVRAKDCWNNSSEQERSEWRSNCKNIIGKNLTSSVEALLNDQCSSVPSALPQIVATTRQLKSLPIFIFKVVSAYSKQLISSQSAAACYLLGTDGSGKSSLAENLSQRLVASGKKVEVSYWGRSRGNSPIVSILRSIVFTVLSILGSNPKSKGASSSNKDKTKKLSYRITVSLGVIVYSIEYWLRYLLQVFVKRSRSTTCLLDRGPYDFLVVKGLFNPLRNLAKIGPHVDGTIFCDAPADAIYKRKPERSIEEINRQQDSYLKFCQERSSHAAVLICDTTLDVAQNGQIAYQFIDSLENYRRGKIDRDLLLTLSRIMSKAEPY